MSNNQTKESIFLAQSQPLDAVLAVIEWGAWKFLAVTTAVFSYNLFDTILANNLSGTSLLWGRIAGVFLLYLVIDAGLTKLLGFIFRQDKKDMTSPMKSFHNFAVLLVVVKVVATMTTSLWAAPEVSEALTDKGNQDVYIADLLATDSLHRVRELEAKSELNGLENSRTKRLKEAKAEGQKLVQNAVATGNRWQRESYRMEGFGWLTNAANPEAADKEYASRIKAAKVKAETLIAAEDGKAAEAKTTLTGIQQDTAYARTNALLTTLAQKEGDAYEQRLQRRTNFFWIFDVMATLFGLLATFLRNKRLKVAGKREPEKNLHSTLSAAMEKWRMDFINYLESILNLDLNGDGTIGGQAPVGIVATMLPQQAPTSIQNPDRVIVAGFQQTPTTPPLPIAGNGGSAVATTPTPFPQPVGAAIAHNSHTFVPEVVEDIEGKVMELCDKFKKEWPKRWRERVEKSGSLITMQVNFTTWHDLLNTYLNDNNAPLSQKAFDRVQEFQEAYKREILPTIKTTQP
jgi:hypothetical protein